MEFKTTGSKSTFFEQYKDMYDRELLEAIWQFGSERYREGYSDAKHTEELDDLIRNQYEEDSQTNNKILNCNTKII